jgi:hypothetical protein
MACAVRGSGVGAGRGAGGAGARWGWEGGWEGAASRGGVSGAGLMTSRAFGGSDVTPKGLPLSRGVEPEMLTQRREPVSAPSSL